MSSNDRSERDDRLTVLTGGPSIEEREQKLIEGADEISGDGRPSILRNPRFLLGVAGTLMTAGLALILLGWLGSAHSTVIEEQVPYLISGGLLGVALAIIGAVCFFSHWVTVLIREARRHEAARHEDHEALMAALAASGTTPVPRARGTRTKN
jgi:hypothetical protein